MGKLDCVLYFSKPACPGSIFVNVLCSAWVQNAVQFSNDRQRLEGEFRSHHARLITYAEEIAFYGGAEREKEIVDESFSYVEQLL